MKICRYKFLNLSPGKINRGKKQKICNNLYIKALSGIVIIVDNGKS